MAQISIDNGRTNVDVESLTNGQVLTACEIASNTECAAYDEVDGQVHLSELDWLKAFCVVFERIEGVAFVAW